MLLRLLFVLMTSAVQLELATGLDNGLAQTPPMAWTSWNLCRFEVNASVIMEVAEALNSTGLQAMGWDTLQIDEGWEACADYGHYTGFESTCKKQTPRDAQGRIVANQTKFAGGIKPLADWLHARGFKIGIYTSASASACGGNWGSRGHETTDANAFAEWGVDWVKVDNCGYGSWAELIESQRVMSKAIQATGRPMIIQIGAGDHMPLMFNPNSSVGGDSYARTFADQAWVWGSEVAHTWYTGDDKHNTWASTVHNVLQNYRGAEFFQKPGAWNFAGDLWCGTGERGDAVVGVPPGGIKMTATEENSTYALWTIMAAPPMLGCDIRHLSAETLEYLSNPELLAVNQDKWGIQGSVVNLGNGSQIIAKPLSDGTYALALWNTGASTTNVSAEWKLLAPERTGSSMAVRDIWNRRNLGVHAGGFSVMVPSHGVTIVKATPA
jgi:alpha-galactosidase